MLRRICFGISLFFIACQPPVVVKPDFDFQTIKRLSVVPVRDISSFPGSGTIIYRSLVHQLLRIGIQVVERNDLSAITMEAAISQTMADNEFDLNLASPDAILICTISEYTNGHLIVIPVITEDKGRTVTTTTETTEPVAIGDGNSESEAAQITTITEEITKIEGIITQTERLEYIDSRVSITLQMIHIETGDILWSNTYRYNSLSIAHAVAQCVYGAVKPLKKIMF